MSERTILVTGGAGYVGSHACKALRAAGYLPIAFDNLVNGHRDLVRWGPLVAGDVLDPDRLDDVMFRYRPQAVMHFAAFAEVGESMREPKRYWVNNFEGSRLVLEAMVRHGIGRIVFSSTCAVYGATSDKPIAESASLRPINPYGASKAAVEGELARFGSNHDIAWTALRYFNAAGADPEGETGEHHEPESHLIPLVLDVALGRRARISIFGNDYPTPDGSCLRDYVHVSDLARAHILALKRLEAGASSSPVNLGSGRAVSVREIVETARRVTGTPVPTVVGARRPGDPPSLVCDTERAKRTLGWRAQHDITTQIGDAWSWHRSRFSEAHGKQRAGQIA